MKSRVVEPTAIPAGGKAMFQLDDIEIDAIGVVFTMQQVDWPMKGGTAAWVTIEYSFDGGATWMLAQKYDLDDVQQGGKTFKGVDIPVGTMVSAVGFRDRGFGKIGRKVRVVVDAVKAVSITGLPEALRSDEKAAIAAIKGK